MNISTTRIGCRLLLAGVLLALGPARVAPAQQSDAEEFERSRPTRTQLAADVVRIPFEITMNKIIIEVSVSGEGPYKFIFDTGAGNTVLWKEFAGELKLPVVGQSVLGDPSDSAQIPVDLVAVEEMRIGGLTVGGFQASSWDRAMHFPVADPPKGIVGFPIFNDYLLTIDFEAQELVVTTGALSAADDHVIGFTTPLGIPELTCTVSGRQAAAHIDTGAPHGVMIPKKYLGEDALQGEPVVLGRARTVNSEFEIKGAQMTGAIEVAGNVIDDPFIMLNDLYDAMNLGYEFLRHFRLTFDQHLGLVRFEPVSAEPIKMGRPNMRQGGHGRQN